MVNTWVVRLVMALTDAIKLKEVVKVESSHGVEPAFTL